MAQDIVATIGTYQKDGETKYVTRKVGSLVDTKHGPRIKLDASFNPAGCLRSDDGGVWLALFEQREREERPKNPSRASAPPPSTDIPDDDIPF